MEQRKLFPRPTGHVLRGALWIIVRIDIIDSNNTLGLYARHATLITILLPSAISFPPPGGFGTCPLKKRAPPDAQHQKSRLIRDEFPPKDAIFRSFFYGVAIFQRPDSFLY